MDEEVHVQKRRDRGAGQGAGTPSNGEPQPTDRAGLPSPAATGAAPNARVLPAPSGGQSTVLASPSKARQVTRLPRKVL